MCVPSSTRLTLRTYRNAPAPRPPEARPKTVLAQRRAARELNLWPVAIQRSGGLVPTGVAGNSAGWAVANGRVGGRESS